MTGPDVDEFVRRAEEVYTTRLRAILEPEHLESVTKPAAPLPGLGRVACGLEFCDSLLDKFVAIEPESGDYFLGKTLSEAIGAARRSYPDRLAHVMRVGHKTALHFGMHAR